MTRHKEKWKKREVDPESIASFPATEEPTAAWLDIRHFTPREFTCKCEGLCDHPSVISLDVVSKLDRIRDTIGRPLTILSGTRCERHNARVKGTLRSSHVPRNGTSYAADIHCPDALFRFAFLTAALPLFKRIGIGREYIHVDDDPELPHEVSWLSL